MHIPDGFLSAPVWATAGAVSLPAVGYFARRAQKEVEESHVPLLGVMGAFVFAAQMINFPVGLGTSGHLLGGSLLAITLGPAAAALVMTAILAVQALIFQDGGVLALGANVLNMGLVGVLAGYLPFHYFSQSGFRRLSIFVGGFVSVMISSSLATFQLLLSGVAIKPSLLAITAFLFVVTAALEGAITLAVVESIERLNPGWVRKSTGTPRRALIILLITAFILAVAGVMIASSLPDGLEALAQKAGIASHAETLVTTPLADYEVNFLSGNWLRKASAGLAGLIVIYVLCIVIGRSVGKRRSV